MTKMFPNPLSSDAVDKFNYKWMLLLLLMLSVASFIIPLHPFYHQDESKGSRAVSQSNQVQGAQEMSKVQVSCWCPRGFTSNQIRYVDSRCRSGVLAALGGDNKTNIYEVAFDSPIPADHEKQYLSISVTRKEYFENKQEDERRDRQRERLDSRVQKLVIFQVPILLLVFALCLAIPQVIWSLLSECCCSFNIGQTLESAKEVTGNQFYEDIYSVFAKSLQSSKLAGVLYLIKKILSIVVVIALLVVAQHSVKEVEELKKEFHKAAPIAETEYSDDNNNQHASKMTQFYPQLFKFPHNIVLCDFSIRAFSRVDTYTVQCSVDAQLNDEHESVDTSSTVKTSSKHSVTELNIQLLSFELMMFHIVITLLCILAVGNIFSCCTWIWKLTSTTSKKSAGLPENTSLDIVLLVQLAHINASVTVAQKLTQDPHRYENVGSFEMAPEKI